MILHEYGHAIHFAQEFAFASNEAGAMHYPENLVGQVHADGRIWSRALWDIRTALGPTIADTVIVEGQFDFVGETMTELAELTVAAARDLYGQAVAGQVQAAFDARGIL